MSNNKVEILSKNLEGFKGEAWHLKKGNKYYVASGVTAFDTGQWEVFVFPSDENGKITDWGEVCGGRGISHDDAVKELEDDNEL